jgi:excisionase family DNA binding protein
MKNRMSYDDAVELTGILKPTLYSLVHRKQIPHIRLSNRLVRFQREELEMWLQSHHVPVCVETDKFSQQCKKSKNSKSNSENINSK